MDTLNPNDNYEPSLNDYDSGQDNKSSNNNFKKNLRSQKYYTRGSGPLRKSAEPEFDSTMTSTDEPRNTNNNTEDTNTEQKRARKPDSPLYTPKGGDREGSYDDREHRRGGRDNYSNNMQRRNLFTNNNRNRHRREFDGGKKGGHTTGTNENPVANNNSYPDMAPPLTNHRSAAMLNQSTKSYERNVNNGPVLANEEETRVAPPASKPADQHGKPADQHGGRDHNRNNYKNNRNNQYPQENRRNYKDYYDRGGRHHYKRRDRDDRQYYDEYGGGGGEYGHAQYSSRHGSTLDVSAEGTGGDKYASSGSLNQSNRRYRGSQSDLGRGQRGNQRWNQDRARNNRSDRSSFQDSRSNEENRSNPDRSNHDNRSNLDRSSFQDSQSNANQDRSSHQDDRLNPDRSSHQDNRSNQDRSSHQDNRSNPDRSSQQDNRSNQDNRSRSNHYKDLAKEEQKGEESGERYNYKRNSQSQQYNRLSKSSPDRDSTPTQDSSIGGSVTRSDHGEQHYTCTAPDSVTELSEQLSGANLKDSSQERPAEEENEMETTDPTEDDSESFIIDPSIIHNEYFAWSKLDWTASVDDDVWATSTINNNEEPQDVIRSDPSPPPSSVYTSPPSLPTPPVEDEKDWASVRNKPPDTRHTTQANQNWSRGPHNNREGGSQLNSKSYGGGGGRHQVQNSGGYGSSYQEYNDRFGEPKRKQYNSSGPPPGTRGGKGQFSGAYWELPPRFRKKQEELEQQQRAANPQPPTTYATGQPPASDTPSYQSLGTYSDSHWKGESVEVRGGGHYNRQDNSHYNSLPPPGRQRHNEGPHREDHNRGRRFSTYETELSSRDPPQPPQSLPVVPVTSPEHANDEEKPKFSWSEAVEQEDKLLKLKSALSVSQAPSQQRGGRGEGRNRGGFHGGRGREERGGDSRGGYGAGYQQPADKLDSRSSSRSRRRRRKSGSSQGSRRRSVSRDTVDTNISSTGTTRSRRNSDRSAASEKNNWRDRTAPQYEHSRSSEVSNWRDRSGNSSSSSTQQDWTRSSLKSSGRATTEHHSWRAPPQISEEPPLRPPNQGLPPSTVPGGLIRLPAQTNRDDGDFPVSSQTNPSHVLLSSNPDSFDNFSRDNSRPSQSIPRHIPPSYDPDSFDSSNRNVDHSQSLRSNRSHSNPSHYNPNPRDLTNLNTNSSNSNFNTNSRDHATHSPSNPSHPNARDFPNADNPSNVRNLSSRSSLHHQNEHSKDYPTPSLISQSNYSSDGYHDVRDNSSCCSNSTLVYDSNSRENPRNSHSNANYDPRASREYPKSSAPTNSRDFPSASQSSRTPLLYNPHNPAAPIPVHSSHSRPVPTPGPHTDRLEYLIIDGQPLRPPEGPGSAYGSAVPKHWYSQRLLTRGHSGKRLLAIVQANNDMCALLAQPGWKDFDLARLNALRDRVKEIFVWFVCHDIKFCQAENVESALWKLAFYNVIETVRNYPSQHAEEARNFASLNALNSLNAVYHKLLNEILDDGISYFEGLLSTLESHYKFKVDNYLNHDGCSQKSLLGCALQCALKLCIFLGDLNRYKATFNGSGNVSDAVCWYVKAHGLNPRNGRPFNQLGLIASTERKQLDAVYYYSRSALTPNPLRSVHERLITVFDENRKLYETCYASGSDQQRLRDSHRKETREYRREIWIHPEDNRPTARNQLIHDTDSEMEAEARTKLAALSHVDLSKQFTCSFLLVHGKLFSKTGLESLPLIAKQMLREFKELLFQNGITVKKLLQLLAVNMFAIEKTQLKDTSLGRDYKSLTQELALIISLEMLYCLVRQCNCLFPENSSNMVNSQSLVEILTNEHFTSLLPAVKIWTDWFVCQTNVWNPPPSTSDYHVGPRDLWTELALLVNNLLVLPCDYSVLVPSESDNSSEKQPSDLVQVRLPEDVMFFGFLPLASIGNIQDPVFTRVSNCMDAVHTALRLKTVIFFGTEFLVGIDPPVLKLHKMDNGRDEYISVVEIVNKEESEEESDSEKGSLDLDAIEEANAGREKDNNVSEESVSSDYQELLEKRLILNKQEEQSEMKKRILESHRKFRVQLEIKPHYLVPDTNCFIDYLPELKSLASRKTAQSTSQLKRQLFTILIPCIVFNELNNISKSAKKAAQVVRNAQIALQYIQSETVIKYVTTRGTLLSKNTFSMEEDDEQMKNDDKILETCLSLARKKPLKKSPVDSATVEIANVIGPNADGLEIIIRDVVLLTEDRNLRLKALARDVPVTNVTHFVKWCNNVRAVAS